MDYAIWDLLKEDVYRGRAEKFTEQELKDGGVTGFLGSLKISLSEERRLKETQNLKCEDRRFQNFPVLKTEDLATKPTKPED